MNKKIIPILILVISIFFLFSLAVKSFGFSDFLTKTTPANFFAQSQPTYSPQQCENDSDCPPGPRYCDTNVSSQDIVRDHYICAGSCYLYSIMTEEECGTGINELLPYCENLTNDAQCNCFPKSNNCKDNINGKWCNYEMGNTFLGACYNQCCINCDPACNSECQNCELVYEGLIPKVKCINKGNGLSCNYEMGNTFLGACLDGECINCDPACNSECQTCKIVYEGSTPITKCVNKGNGLSCNYEMGNTFLGICLDGSCSNCEPPCTSECQSCKLFLDTARCMNKKNGVPCNYLSGEGFLGECKSGICADKCDPPCKDCEKCTKSGEDEPFCEADSDKKGDSCQLEEEDPPGGECNSQGECIKTSCPPPTRSCKKCVIPDEGDAFWKNDPDKNGLSCDYTDGDGDKEDGFCKNGDCKEKNCVNLGLGQNCGSTSSGLKCCKDSPEEYCCNKTLGGGPDGTESCCKRGTKSNNINNFIQKCTKLAGASICNPNICPSNLPVRCPSTGDSNKNVCCPSGSSCLSVGGTLWPKVEYCGQNTCNTDQGEHKCPSDNDPFNSNNNQNSYCCKSNETCTSVLGYPACVTNSCPAEDEHACEGVGEGKAYKVCCKTGVEACGSHPNGLPKCINLGLPIPNPSPDNNTSIYMTRDSDLFSLNGIAYAITPHLNFNQNFTLALNEPGQLYKYSSHDRVLNICDNTSLDSIVQQIGPSGGTISLSDIIMDIPANALLEETEITITKYDLSNCSTLGEGNDLNYALSLMESQTFITNCQELQAMKNNLGADYILANNIDCSETSSWNNGKGFDPVGGDHFYQKFSGSLEGNGYEIRNLYINRPTERDVALFGRSGGFISNVRMVDADINSWIGAASLVGVNYVEGQIYGCSATGNIESDYNAGGLVGYNGGLIKRSFSDIEVTATGDKAGGIAGLNNPEGIIEETYALGNVFGIKAGGLVGYNQGGIIRNCYSKGDVTGFRYIGGLVGYNLGIIGVAYPSKIINSYSSADNILCLSLSDCGGLVGEGPVTKSYYDQDNVLCFGCDNNTGQESWEHMIDTNWLKLQGWDFINIWDDINHNIDYPILRDELSCGEDPVELGAIDKTTLEFNSSSFNPGDGQINLEWTYTNSKGYSQDEYNLQVADNPSFANPIVDTFASQTIPNGERGTAGIIISDEPTPDTNDNIIGYYGLSTPLYWRVRVKDNQETWSTWADDPQFYTPEHPYAWPSFEYIVQEIETPGPNPSDPLMISYQTDFINHSKCFTCIGAENPCNIVETACAGWIWDFHDINIPNSNIFETTHIYQSPGIYNVSLTAIDIDGNPYTKTKSLLVAIKVRIISPKWKETIPF